MCSQNFTSNSSVKMYIKEWFLKGWLLLLWFKISSIFIPTEKNKPIWDTRTICLCDWKCEGMPSLVWTYGFVWSYWSLRYSFASYKGYLKLLILQICCEALICYGFIWFKDHFILSIVSNLGDRWDNGSEVLEVHKSVREKTWDSN